jgi:DNA-binding NarL/FixJ family response regulator
MIKIIVIEDHPIVLDGIRYLLNQIADFKVVSEFRNGKEFIDQLDVIEADIILTDIDMPVMDGITLTKIATAKDPDIKIIALSMYYDSKYYYDMVTAGAKGFVLKQSSSGELEDAIRVVHSGGNYFSQELLHNVILSMQSLNNTASEKKKIFDLSERELEYLTYICNGLTNRELADILFVSVRTVESNKAKLMDKTGTKNNAGLIIWAIKNKIVDL